MIDEQATYKKFGYYSYELKPQSHKPIVRVCDGCGKSKVIPKYNYHDLCWLCIRKQKWNLPKPKFIKEQDRFIPNTEIDRIATIEKFGYDPVDLVKGSVRKVIVVCQKCCKSRIIDFRSYRDLCSLCTHKEEETRIIISCTIQGISRDEFTGFLTNQKYCKLFNDSFKEKIRNQYHNKCFICGKKSNRKLDVHHVNYNKNCLCGSNCEFVPLCRSCHMKTNYNRQYWEDLIMCYLYPNRYFMINI